MGVVKSRVAVLKSRPETVLADYHELMNLAGYREVVVPAVDTALPLPGGTLGARLQHFDGSANNRKTRFVGAPALPIFGQAVEQVPAGVYERGVGHEEDSRHDQRTEAAGAKQRRDERQRKQLAGCG